MNIYEIVYTEEFWIDTKVVIHWYDSISTELGNRFLSQIWFAESQIHTNPNVFSKITKTGFRRSLLKKFPYKIFIRVAERKIIFIALVHVSRSNSYIKRRLK